MYTLIDTDILIDASHADGIALSTLQHIEQTSHLAISIITEMELTVGCRNKTEVRELTKFLRRFEVIALNEGSSKIALKLLQQYRLSHGLAIPDSLIAATAIDLDIPLISKNQRDYRFITELHLLPYPPA
ncbi:type II toxin-antitoxin system VapC family toxin [Thiofilum flexile]|uniref:type II toxin-antitoxin system VapC family toxin n=1 Tax=Thiofilum flexile TaxID=125627 RepID=UPI00036A68CC|nr:type II toxin-antitoxin system VapC family toxin [Thiofilum flexile]